MLSERGLRRAAETLLFQRRELMAVVILITESCLWFAGTFHLGVGSVSSAAFALFYISRMLVDKYQFLEGVIFPDLDNPADVQACTKLLEDIMALKKMVKGKEKARGVGALCILALFGPFHVCVVLANFILFAPVVMSRMNCLGEIARAASSE